MSGRSIITGKVKVDTPDIRNVNKMSKIEGFTLTGAMLKSVAPSLSDELAKELADLHNEICPLYGINTADRLHEFVAQCAHESEEYKRKVENLNYSAQGLLKIFPKYFNTISAEKCARNPERIANIVYANRMGNGDWRSGDGFKNRGGGYIQITGYDMYKKFADYKGDTVENIRELVRSSNRYALESACWVFAVEKQLLDEADADDMLLITKRINGGTNGLSDRMKYYDRAKKHIR